jgi:acyl carrier protein
MTKEILSQELCTFIKSTIADKKVHVDPATAFSDIGIDSLSIIELVLFIERKFKITLPEEELIPENFKSAATLAQCAIRYLNS